MQTEQQDPAAFYVELSRYIKTGDSPVVSGEWLLSYWRFLMEMKEGPSLVQENMDGLESPFQSQCTAHCKKVGISWMLRYCKVAFFLLAFCSLDFAV